MTQAMTAHLGEARWSCTGGAGTWAWSIRRSYDHYSPAAARSRDMRMSGLDVAVV
jgi:hypothetical protein